MGDELRQLAAKYVWWQTPEVTLGRPHYLLCQLMTLGTEDDVRAARQWVGDAAFIDALEHAPPGVMDARSWNYWHLFYGRPTPPLPERPVS
jgi:hypothetical protein